MKGLNNSVEEDDLYERFSILVDPGQELLRIDKYLMDRLPHVSRNIIQSAIEEGMILVNDKQTKRSYKVHPGDRITGVSVSPPREFKLVPEKVDFEVVFEDETVLVVDKPAGLVVHPGHGNYSGTLVHGLFHYLNLDPEIADNIRPGLVHRIDKDTSGLLVIAKTDHAMTSLAKQFFDHSVERRYQAIVWGDFDEPEGSIEGYIGRSKKNRTVYTVHEDEEQGKWAKTHYKVIESFGYVSLLEFQLETGRTHQIRVHCKYIKHPIFNDSTYGGDRILRGTVYTKYRQFVENCFKLLPRQALHAKTLGFVHPVSKEFMRFESELPEDFSAALSKWKNYVANRSETNL